MSCLAAGSRLTSHALASPKSPQRASGPPLIRVVASAAGPSRRDLLVGSLALPALTLLPANTAGAEEEAAAAPASSAGTLYFDEQDKFEILVPPGWQRGAGDLSGRRNKYSNAEGLRRVVAWYPEGKPEVTVAVTVTTLGPDYTAMGSFGTAEQFGTNVVASMDRSYLLRAPEWARRNEGPVQVAKLLGAREAGKAYYVDYRLEKEDEAPRTVLSVVAMGSNGRTRRLYTVNAIAQEPDLQAFRPALEKVVASFKAPADA